ncbi:flagellar hook-basal body protein [Desulfatirhabdium butyrativorans]|uniref:flagellar hook-basal body protein n=1 Tax=Desulfatirhabdium butyrativorans TaxID=340467 RepID=UPI00041E5306|nr:flagellar hook basal-body protein [Desulfatirhabdium butyrativorans]
MMSSMNTAITGLKANTSQMAIIGDNIANVNTIGFKASEGVFENVISQSTKAIQGNEIGSGVLLSDVRYDFGQGSIQQTGNPYDISITGNGFFAVYDSVNNQTYYTRAGQFSFNSAGNLIDQNGYEVRGYNLNGNDPPADPTSMTPESIKIDPEAYSDISVDANGVYYAVDKGTGNKVALFQISINDVTDRSTMAKMSGNLYTLVQDINGQFPTPKSDVAGANGMGGVNPGTIEGSNVDLAKEFVNMIVAQRAFTANSKVITSSDEILQELVNIKR